MVNSVTQVVRHNISKRVSNDAVFFIKIDSIISILETAEVYYERY